MNKNVGQYLKELREKKHLSQNELATKLHISRSVIAKYETGEREPSFNNLIILSKFFKVPITDLIPIYERNIKSNNTKDVLNYLLRQNRIFKTALLTLAVSLVMIIVTALIYISILNYVSTKVYKIVSLEDSSVVKDGILVTTRDKTYFYLNNSIQKDNVKEIKFYFLDGNKIIYIFATSVINNLKFFDDLNDNEYINFRNYKAFFNNSYLEICSKDGSTKSVKLTYEFDYTNNNLEKNEEKKIMDSEPIKEKIIKPYSIYAKSKLYDIATPFVETHNLEYFNVKIDGIKYEVFILNDDLNIYYEHKKHKYNLIYSNIDDYEELKLNDMTNSTESLYYANLTNDTCSGNLCNNIEKDTNLIKEIINLIQK